MGLVTLAATPIVVTAERGVGGDLGQDDREAVEGSSIHVWVRPEGSVAAPMTGTSAAVSRACSARTFAQSAAKEQQVCRAVVSRSGSDRTMAQLCLA